MSEAITKNIQDVLKSNRFHCIRNGNEEVSDFIDNIKNSEHCVLIFHTEEMRNKIISEFFNPKILYKVTTACFTHTPSKFSCDHEITYDELLENNKFQPMIINDFLIDVIDKPYTPESTRIACEDTSWFAEKGYFDEHQQCGSVIAKHLMENSSLLCCYNPTKLKNIQLDTVLSNSKYVIVDTPFSVYEKIEN